MIGIPSSVGDTALEDKVCQVYHEIGVEVAKRDIQSFHRLKKDKSQMVVKFSNSEDSLEILRKKNTVA